MSVERAADHPTFELGGNTIVSLAGGGLPRHHHDHLDVFAVETGGGSFHLGDETITLEPGDSVVVPIGAWHHFVAGAGGATLAVTMLAGTKLIREDGSETVPPWVS